MTDATSGIPELLLVLTRMGVAFLLGAAIGFERQWNQKTAGLRTNALVAVGACGFVLFGVLLHEAPTLIAGQIVTGPYVPSQVCFAPDHSIWTLGSEDWRRLSAGNRDRPELLKRQAQPLAACSVAPALEPNTR